MNFENWREFAEKLKLADADVRENVNWIMDRLLEEKNKEESEQKKVDKK